MHPIVNHLIQLQELMLIRDEQRIVHGGNHLEQLEASIKAMTGKLPREIRGTFEKLRKKDAIVVAPISNGNCASCGMKLAISHVQAVRLARDVQSCPNCARMLYCLDTAARSVKEKASRIAPRKAGVSRFSSATLMLPALASDDKEGVIRELALKMETEGFVDNGERLCEEALRRETILSTAVGHGLAVPHARAVEGGGLTFAVGVSRKGIRFDESSKALTKIVFFIAIPTAASAFYLKLLSGLTETFREADARKALMAEKDPEGMWKALTKVTRRTIK
jgi:mannitol/fructose-specific phosphotransferase system IIA component (Ntr-type)